MQDSAATDVKRRRPKSQRPEAAGQPTNLVSTEPSAHLTPATIISLQRVIGNHAVRQLVMQHTPSTSLTPEALPSRPAMVQRWGEKEHKITGDYGSGHRRYEFAKDGSVTEVQGAQVPQPGDRPFRLTHGDINMLGDWFELQDTKTVVGNDGKPATFPNIDSLFVLAQRPSFAPGQRPGTWDEIIYAIYENNPKDPRFDRNATGPDAGLWADITTFSDDVKKRVDARYLRLASQNTAHFPTPKVGGPTGNSYRDLHEDTILRAFKAGQQGRNVAEALVHEAAAQHFLTDYFSAGHLRTPIVSIREYWQAKYPLFFDNLKKKIALDVARYMNEHETGVATIFGTVNAIYDSVLGSVEEKTKDLPPFTFGDVVGRVVHDIDNVEGVSVVNDLGDKWKTYGDSHLGKTPPSGEQNLTAMEMQRAVRLGNSDIEHAYQIGTSTPGELSLQELCAKVKQQTQSPATLGDKYAPEQVVPHLDTSVDNGQQNWQVDSVEQLWKLRVRSDLPKTWEDAIKENLTTGEIGSKLTGIASKFPATQKKAGQTLHPQKAYLNGFVGPLKAKPREGLLGIIDFDPTQGQVFFNKDDIVMEELKGEGHRPGMTDKQLRGMTIVQRVRRIKALVGGSVGADEGEQVIRLFKTARPAVRAEIYRQVEGHLWKGDWKHGWFTWDDDIWNGLNRNQLKRLRAIINEK